MILFDLGNVKIKIEELEKLTLKSEFWNDSVKSKDVLQKIKNLKSKIEKNDQLLNLYSDIETLIEIGIEEKDEDVIPEARKEYKKLIKIIEKFEIETLLNNKYDRNNAIISLHPGAGGTESQDWVEMLYRMYTRWAVKNGFEIKELDYLAGDEAGIKSVTAIVSGEYAYGYLKAEKGVHRLIRISPFDSSGRRHTSFASLDVIPEITDDIKIEIRQEDLRIDTYRASGAGGQHINKTDSAVRITHIPTGIVTSCQTERSQTQNKENAMKMLKSKLYEIKEREQKEKIEDIKGDYKEIAWGNQIRTYVFHPYNMVKDHRTNYEEGNISSVMDGEIDEFIEAYLKKEKNINKEENL